MRCSKVHEVLPTLSLKDISVTVAAYPFSFLAIGPKVKLYSIWFYVIAATYLAWWQRPGMVDKRHHEFELHKVRF